MSAITAPAVSTRPDAFLRLAMRADAVIVGVVGVALLAAANPAAELTGLPVAVERGVVPHRSSNSSKRSKGRFMSALTAPAVSTRPDAFLRLAMRADAVIVGVIGVALLAGAQAAADITGLPVAVEHGVGVFSVVYGVVVLALAALDRVRPGGIATVIANLVCTVIAAAVILTGMFPLTGIGIAAVVVTGLYTLVMAELQYVGLRRLTA